MNALTNEFIEINERLVNLANIKIIRKADSGAGQTEIEFIDGSVYKFSTPFDKIKANLKVFIL